MEHLDKCLESSLVKVTLSQLFQKKKKKRMKHKDSFLKDEQKEFRITAFTKYDCLEQQIY